RTGRNDHRPAGSVAWWLEGVRWGEAYTPRPDRRLRPTARPSTATPNSRTDAGWGMSRGVGTASGITWPDDIVAVAEPVVPLRKSNELAPAMIFMTKSPGMIFPGEKSETKAVLPDAMATSSEP